MGKGYDYTRKVALEAAKAQLDKLLSSNAVKKSDCQVGLISNDLGQVTYADGTQQILTGIIGQIGQALIVCNGIAINPEPVQVQLDAGGSKGMIVGFNSSDKSYYLRNIGNPSKGMIPPGDPNNLSLTLDTRIADKDRSARISADGKALVIGGVFQDIPADYDFSKFENSNTNAYNPTPVPGYSYHTIVQYVIYTSPKLVTVTENGTAVTKFQFDQGFFGSLDVTEEATGKIPPPAQEGLGSSAVYRMFPSSADLNVPTQNTVTGAPAYSHARFFPAVFQSYITQGAPFTVFNPIANTNYTQVQTTGNMNTAWSGNGDSLPLFKGKDQPWGCTEAQFLFAFNIQTVEDEANSVPVDSYVLDVICDITYGTSFQIDSDNIQTYNEWAWQQPADLHGNVFFANCHSSQLASQNYINAITNPGLYPFIPPFHNLAADEYKIPGTITPKGLALFEPNLVYDQGGFGTFLINPDGSGDVVSGSLTATFTNFGPLCNQGSNCIYFFLKGQGPDGSGQCRGPGLTETCDFCGYVTSNEYTIRDWDGTFFDITNFGPLFNAGIGGFFIFPRDGGCAPPICPGTNGFMSVVDSFFLDFTGGFFDAYRYGRGICAFNRMAVIAPVIAGTGFEFVDQAYKGPTIVVSRLMSPLAQNHLYQTFRGSTNNTACTYQVVDPYVPPDADGQHVQNYQDLIDELNNPAAFDGQDVIDADIQNQVPVPGHTIAFSAFFWGDNYTDEGIAVDQSNFVAPPDVMTDKILSPHGTWPIPYTLIKGVDSYIVQSYDILTTTVGGVVTKQERIQIYNIAVDGLISTGRQSLGSYQLTEELILDWMLPISVGQ